MLNLIIPRTPLVVTDYVHVDNVNFELTGEWTGIHPHRWIVSATSDEIPNLSVEEPYVLPFQHHFDMDGTLVIDSRRGKKTETLIRYIQYINSSKEVKQQVSDYIDSYKGILAFKRAALAIEKLF